jgi:hypothetical protein
MKESPQLAKHCLWLVAFQVKGLNTHQIAARTEAEEDQRAIEERAKSHLGKWPDQLTERERVELRKWLVDSKNRQSPDGQGGNKHQAVWKAIQDVSKLIELKLRSVRRGRPKRT